MTQRNLQPDTHNELGATLRNGRVLALILVFLAVIFTIGYAQRAATLADVQDQLRQMEAQIEAAHYRTAELQAELRYVASDEFLDKIARQELGMVRPGEVALILVEPSAPVARAGDAAGLATDASPETPAPAAVLRAAPSQLHMPVGSGVTLSASEPSIWQAWLELFALPVRP